MSKKHKETLSIISSTEKDSLFFGSCIAISPDSQQIVTFIPETREFKLYDTSLNKHIRIFKLKSEINGKRLYWSMAISNCVDDGGNERFIALSCFDEIRFRDDIVHGESEEYLDTSLELIGGVIRFLDSPLKNKTIIIMVNALGIFKETMNHNKRKQRFFSQSSNIEQFELPQHLSIRLRLSRNHWQNSLELLHASVIKNHFVVHSFEKRQLIIEMYSLITGDLEMLFKHNAPKIIHNSPIFAVSQGERFLAFCETTCITLFFMENGLKITTKQLTDQKGIYKIIGINFIDDDSKLLIVLEEKEVKILKNQIFVVWDLFTTFENSIRQIDYSIKMNATLRLMKSDGKMFAVRDNGDIFSVLDLADSDLIYPSVKVTNIDISTRDHVCHAIYNMDGERFDASKLAKNRIIIDNVEPWHPNKNYFRISVYLDSTEITQLIISSNTIQVWKYRNINTTEKLDKRCDRVLEYIWARNKAIDVRELRIREREFVLKVSVPSSKSYTPPKSMTIHWPNNVNVLEGACRALYVLEVKKHDVEGRENVNQIKYLIECTQRLVRKYITKYGEFRLTSIRYPIMKFLIKSYQENLINHILNTRINGKNCNIYIPRLYKWVADEDNNRSITKSDLHHAILCIQERGDSKVILKYLIDYYTDNTKEYNNYGWMFTVSKAIPLLYDNNLREFVQYLFQKPCFGITEAYTSPLHISPYDQRKGNNAAVMYSLVVKPCLAPIHNTRWFFFKNLFTRIETSHKNRKVYIVPLPDFTTPTLMAVLDFKWSAVHSKIMLAVCSSVYGYTGLYLIATEFMQLKREGLYRYVNIYNIFDLGSLLLPLAIIIVRILGYLGKIILQNSVIIPVGALTALIAWLEVLFLLRYFEVPGRFVYIIINILNTIWPFFAFMLSVVLAFVEAVFFWNNGRWNSYAADAMSILGFIILVLIFQNMLIAFMKSKSRTAVRRYRTEFIEALDKPFCKKTNPRYIYYIPDPNMIDTWLEETKKDEEQKLRLMGENLAELTDLTNFDYSDDDEGDNDQGSSSTMNIEPSTTEYCDEEIFVLKVTPKRIEQ
ncbi:2764_t:CDS:10 [Diversispora eburnea]|uniref:2764_t:CDS:1 n=1 Tax=Diversispora eburnea TaxID=1213867 RepID=A0A9N9AR08_9GLOM|nr:2764_t:CDS:10 [Diversispora eburnea]